VCGELGKVLGLGAFLIRFEQLPDYLNCMILLHTFSLQQTGQQWPVCCIKSLDK